MKQIDLAPINVRFISAKAQVLADKSFKRTAVLAAVWCAAVIGFGRLFDHGLPWYLIAAPAFAPAAILAFLVISLDDGLSR